MKYKSHKLPKRGVCRTYPGIPVTDSATGLELAAKVHLDIS
jgi:hypothetical protein